MLTMTHSTCLYLYFYLYLYFISRLVLCSQWPTLHLWESRHRYPSFIKTLCVITGQCLIIWERREAYYSSDFRNHWIHGEFSTSQMGISNGSSSMDHHQWMINGSSSMDDQWIIINWSSMNHYQIDDCEF